MMKQLCEIFLDEAMEYHDLPGLVIGVSRRGEEYTGARGVRDILTGDPLQADDVFHCASISKLFTSSAIMRLVEEGSLDPDDRLRDILPDLFGNGIRDSRWEDIRLYQILSHTAGIGDVKDYRWEECLTSEHALSDYVHSEEVIGQPLLWAPGQGGFRYSNIGYEILGHIIAVKSGLSYEAFVRQNLMEPAGMRDASMLTWERVFADAPVGEPEDGPEKVLTTQIRRRNAECGGAAGLDTAGGGTNRTAGSDAADGGTNRTAGSDAAGGGPDPLSVGANAPVSWRPMALPHEKAPDRSIVPVKYYPYTRSHAPSSTLTATAHDLLQWARAHMQGFAAAAGLSGVSSGWAAAGSSGVSSGWAAEGSSGVSSGWATAGSSGMSSEWAAAGSSGVSSEWVSNRSSEGSSGCPSEKLPGAGILSTASYQTICREYAEVPGNREKMGLGWFMRRQGGCRLYGHEGMDDGFRSSLWICPEKELGIVVLSNLSVAPVKKLNKKLFDQLTNDYSSHSCHPRS